MITPRLHVFWLNPISKNCGSNESCYSHESTPPPSRKARSLTCLLPNPKRDSIWFHLCNDPLLILPSSPSSSSPSSRGDQFYAELCLSVSTAFPLTAAKPCGSFIEMLGLSPAQQSPPAFSPDRTVWAEAKCAFHCLTINPPVNSEILTPVGTTEDCFLVYLCVFLSIIHQSDFSDGLRELNDRKVNC